MYGQEEVFSLRGTGFQPVNHGQACPERSRRNGRATMGGSLIPIVVIGMGMAVFTLNTYMWRTRYWKERGARRLDPRVQKRNLAHPTDAVELFVEIGEKSWRIWQFM